MVLAESGRLLVGVEAARTIRGVHHPEFERLCDLADVKGLVVGLTVGAKLRRRGSEHYRDLEAITVHDSRRPRPVSPPTVRIHRSIDVAARRLLEAIT